MRASVISENSFACKNIEKPVLTGKGAIIKVIGCGLCGSDIVKFKHKIAPDGTVLGHETVGII